MPIQKTQRKKNVSQWLPIAILFLGLIFFAFIIIEYQRNTSLIEQNKTLISNSAKARLINNLLAQNSSQNWANHTDSYEWIKHKPTTYWFNNDEQIFPWKRQIPEKTKQGLNWQTLWLEINGAATKNSEKHLDQQRLVLLSSVREALISNDEKLIEKAFNTYIEHTHVYNLDPKQEVAFSLKLVELGAKEHWSPKLIHAILITGGSTEAPIIRPVVDLLFRHADQFSHDNFNSIIIKINRNIEAFNLSPYFLNSYLSHLDNPQLTLPKNTNDLNSTVITTDGWVLTRMSNQQVIANQVGLKQQLKRVQYEFIDLSVINEGDSLTLNELTDTTLLKNLKVSTNKAQLNKDKVNQTFYLLVKSFMLLAFIALILLTLRLIEKNQQRRSEYLALKEDFVKLVSHELKTPLAGIRAMAETLQKRIDRGLSVQTYPERIINEADKLWYMVDNILGFNRVQANNEILDKRVTQLKLLSDNVISQVQSFSNKPYIISNTIDESIEIIVDIELFSLVIKNILVNAGLYNVNDQIKIQLSYDKSSSQLLISDNGIGISKEDEQRVFEPFVRLTQSVRQSGTGLGLAICKRIMQLHKGDLSLDESNNNGSVWKISITQ